MKGTEKQIKWANNIIKETTFFKNIPELIKTIKLDETSCKDEDKFNYAIETIKIIFDIVSNDSKIIIENRNDLDDERFLFETFDSLKTDRKKTFSRVIRGIYKKNYEN